jgi:signal peptidase I
MKKLIGALIVLFAITAYADQVITCKTWAGAVFVWHGYQCPSGSMQTF